MSRVLEGLAPEKVFYFFEEICKIPHPSYREKQISDYLAAFARERGLECIQDEWYNVIIIKEASPGYEDAAPVILQGHMDMVCEKERDCPKDMEKEGLDLVVEGDFISARGTTLGGDDGIAVAMGLAILDSEELLHPRLELVVTVSEEVGMEGASGIDLSMLHGKKLLNLDSEEEGVFLAGCAGGGLVTLTLPLEREQASAVSGLEITVEGLQGGHSGTEINKGRGNANVLLTELLYQAYREEPFLLVELSGGTKDNAITRESRAVVTAEDREKLAGILRREAEKQTKAFREKEPGLVIRIKESDGPVFLPMTGPVTKELLSMTHRLPYGVIAMCPGMDNLVETSLNPGIMTTKEEKFLLCYCVRSSREEAFDELITRLRDIAEAHGASYGIKGRYPAWEFAEDSPLRREMMEIFEEMFGKKPVVEVMHAGVECGQLAQKIPGLDCVSFGPNLYDIHTPKERMSISSVKRTYDFVLEILKRAK